MDASATMLEPRLVNARTAARVLGVPVFTVRRLTREGALPARRFGRRGNYRFLVEDLDEFVVSGHPRGAVEPEASAPASVPPKRVGVEAGARI